MEIGVHLPQTSPAADRELTISFARTAEQLGFDSLWVSDHIVLPQHIDSRYPYHPEGRFPWPPTHPWLEPISTLLFVAGCTERPRLGISVMVVPLRNPVLTAKMLATLDVLSGGRLILGAGVGWMAEEFSLLDVPFQRRGLRTDEYLQVIKALWTEESPSFAGEFYTMAEAACYPKPLQQPHPPIWIGGGGDAALRRTARFGNAWHVTGREPDIPGKYQQLRRYAQDSGRDPNSITLTARTGISPDRLGDARERLLGYQAMGVSHIVLEFRAESLDQAERTMRLFNQEVRPSLQG